MKQIRKRLTYANVMSSIAVFLVLGGATALAAGQLGKNSVGTKQLKSNSVTTAKIKSSAVTTKKIKSNAITAAQVKPGSLTGANINLATLGTVPSASAATTANVANSVKNRFPFTFFMPPGLRNIVTIGPFSIKANCEINNSGRDIAELQLTTSVDHASMDDNSGNEFSTFDTSNNPAELVEINDPTGTEDIESDEGELMAVAPDGTTIATENHAVGVNIANHPGECFFAGTVDQIVG